MSLSCLLCDTFTIFVDCRSLYVLKAQPVWHTGKAQWTFAEWMNKWMKRRKSPWRWTEWKEVGTRGRRNNGTNERAVTLGDEKERVRENEWRSVDRSQRKDEIHVAWVDRGSPGGRFVLWVTSVKTEMGEQVMGCVLDARLHAEVDHIWSPSSALMWSSHSRAPLWAPLLVS